MKVSSLVVLSVLLAGQGAAVDPLWLSNTFFQLGNNPTTSINTNGELTYPRYRPEGYADYIQLVFDGNPCRQWIGVNGDGTDMYNTNGNKGALSSFVTVAEEVKASKYITTDFGGFGILTASRTIVADGKLVTFSHTATLGPSKRFVKVKSTVSLAADAAGPLTNVRIWAGIGDDWVSNDDTTSKVRGRITKDGFAPLENSLDYGNSVLATSDDGHTAFLFTTLANSDSVLPSSWSSQLGGLSSVDRNTQPIGYNNKDSGYGLYMRLADLQPGDSASATWYLGAGLQAEILPLLQGLADEALARPVVRAMTKEFFGAVFGTMGAAMIIVVGVVLAI